MQKESILPKLEYIDIFLNSPVAKLIVAADAPVYTMLDANIPYLATTNSTRESLVGKSVFEVFPANPTDEVSKNIERTIFSFDQAIHTKEVHIMSNYRYDIPIEGTVGFEERYWTTSNTPVLNAAGDVLYLIHSPANVTELNKLAQREKAASEALINQRQQLYSTFMQAPVGIAILRGPQYVTELINPSLCKLYGKSAEEMLGKPFFDNVNYSKGLELETVLDNVHLTGIPYHGKELSLPIERNGILENVYVNFVYEPFREDDKSISGVIAIAIEVTDLVQAKQQLEEAEERARLAVDAVDLGTFDLNLVTLELVTSMTFAAIFGFKKPVSRRKYIKVMHPEDRDIWSTAHKVAIDGGFLFYEVRLIWPDQSAHWARVEGKVYYNSENKPVRILGTLLDITDWKLSIQEQQRLTERITESEQLLRSITTAAPTGLWMSDKDGAITYVNQTWIQWTGLSFIENLGTGWLNILYDEDRGRASSIFLEDLLHQRPFEVEFRIAHADGMLHWCVATGMPQYNFKGDFTGYIGSTVDINQQKLLQQQKDDFLGIASHELKTPVTSIKAYAQVLEQMLQEKGDIKEAAMIARMDVQVTRLTNLIADLLDVTKIRSGKLQFNSSHFDFNDLIRELVEDMQRTTDRHDIIENLSSTVIIYGDADRIGQVITNLLSNAIKYSPKADKIIITSTVEDSTITLCVQDFGIGIPEDKVDKVFDQFYRVTGNMQHAFPGLGLGLYISAEIIKREGGRIWVSTKEGQGSIFYFSLPLSKQA